MRVPGRGVGWGSNCRRQPGSLIRRRGAGGAAWPSPPLPCRDEMARCPGPLPPSQLFQQVLLSLNPQACTLACTLPRLPGASLAS